MRRNVLTCDVCGDELSDKYARKIVKRFRWPWELTEHTEVEHICDDCWGSFRQFVREETDKEED